MARNSTQRKVASPEGITAPQRRAQLTVGIVTVQRRAPPGLRFCVLDGPVRVVIEAVSEFDARCLCREMGFEFIGLCD